MNDPIRKFAQWYAEASDKPGYDPSAMAVATATKAGAPSVRMVLLKAHDARGFVFYTNLESRKSEEIKENPRAALCFYWPWIGRQVRVEGRVEAVSAIEADRYFAGRAFESNLGSVASLQSRPLPAREELLKRVEELRARHSAENPPHRPAHWSGWRVVPERMEFWSHGEHRLHDRELFEREGEHWQARLLYP